MDVQKGLQAALVMMQTSICCVCIDLHTLSLGVHAMQCTGQFAAYGQCLGQAVLNSSYGDIITH